MSNSRGNKELLSLGLIYIPSIVILVFALIAQHSARVTSGAQRDLLAHYKEGSSLAIELQDSYSAFERALVIASYDNSAYTTHEIENLFERFLGVYLRYKESLEDQTEFVLPQNYLRIFYDVEEHFDAIHDEIGRLHYGLPFKNAKVYEKLLAPVGDGIHGVRTVLYSDNERSRLSTLIQERQAYMYWSVFAVGLMGFVLLIVNSYQVARFKKLSEEREKSLKIQEHRLAALEAAYDGIGIVDEHGDLTYMNSALMRLHGIPPDECEAYIGSSWLDLYTSEGKKNIKKDVMPVLVEKGYWRGEAPIVRKNGEVIIAEMSLTHLPDGGAIGTARDVTESKKNSQEKEELQEQFYQAQKMEAVGRLAGGIAHDFNNILAAMNGYAEFLLEDLKKGSAEHQYAKNIVAAGHQARILVDQMLAFSRRSESAMGLLNLKEPMAECLSMLKATMPKTIELKSSVDIDAPFIHGNAAQISQVLMNLCVNAIDAMEDVHGELELSLEFSELTDYMPSDMIKNHLPETSENPPIRIDEVDFNRTKLFLNTVCRDNEYLCLTVRDTGAGMSKNIMERVFEPFFTTKSVDKGTGLGLANVHGVLTSHQGALVIDSTKGKGTSFHLLIPLTKERHEEIEIKDVEDIKLGAGEILLVEDQEEVRQMMTRMLERLGLDTHVATTGLEALDILRENPGAIDLVITDQNMPKMTGLELVYQANIDFPDLPFILLSGYSEQKLKDLMREHPAIKAILRKPISKRDLATEISRVLNLAHGLDEQGKNAAA